MIQALNIVQSVMRSASWPVPETITGSTDPKVLKTLQAVNFIGQALGRRRDWRWLHRTETFQTVEEHTEGTVDVVKGSKDVVGTLTDWTTQLEGRIFKSRSFDEIYRVKKVDSPTALTLEHDYNGDDQEDLAYTIAQNFYPLNEDLDNELNLLEFIKPSSVDILSPEELDEIKISHVTVFSTDTPRFATIRGLKDGKLVLEVWPYSKDARLLQYSYYAALKKLEKDDDEWPFPEHFESMIHDGALSYIRQNAQDDVRTQLDLQRFVEQRTETASVARKGDQVGRFISSTGERRLRNRRRRRLSPARYDLGSAFDR